MIEKKLWLIVVVVLTTLSNFPHLLPILYPSNNTIVIDERHEATVDFTTTNSANEGSTWKWIGGNADANKYLLSGH